MFVMTPMTNLMTYHSLLELVSLFEVMLRLEDSIGAAK